MIEWWQAAVLGAVAMAVAMIVSAWIGGHLRAWRWRKSTRKFFRSRRDHA